MRGNIWTPRRYLYAEQYQVTRTHTGQYSPELQAEVCGIGRVPRKNVKKTDIYWGSYGIYIFIFFTPLQIFVPLLEIIFFNNHYFLVCIFKYCTSTRVNYVIEIYRYCFYSNNTHSNNTKIGQEKQKYQRVRAVRLPECLFTMSVSAVLFFHSFFANIQFHWCSALISIGAYFKYTEGTTLSEHCSSDIIRH